MKLLRSPAVTGVLVVIAVIVMFFQFGGAKLFRGKPAATAQKPATPAPATVPAPAQQSQPLSLQVRPAAKAASQSTTNLAEALLPDQPIDSAFIEKRFNFWVQSPLRDPFLLLQPIVENPDKSLVETNSPVPTWTLKAIWNQTDSRLAVINNRVYRVGDVIVEGYKLIRIEVDEVWFQGPTHHERLGFPQKKQAAPVDQKNRKPTPATTARNA